MKKYFSIILLLCFLILSCKKEKNTCELDMCDENRKTILTATNWSGTISYYNNLQKWAINVPIPNTVDRFRTCIICNNIEDSLKMVGKVVTFSGNLKESCNNQTPELGGQEIYFITPTKLK